MKTALLASYTKDDELLRLARLLSGAGWELMGSAGTAKYLSHNGIACRDVAELAGGAPILGHRVVTLARKVYAALLAVTDDDFKELERANIPTIGLVYVTLYPLEETIKDPKATEHDVLEKTDIGGPTLLRAAAKGRRITLSSAMQIDELERWIANGCLDKDKEKLVVKFAAAAERRIADYVNASATYWESKVK